MRGSAARARARARALARALAAGPDGASYTCDSLLRTRRSVARVAMRLRDAARLLERRAMEAVQETMAGYGGMVGAKGIGRANAEGPANGGGRHDGELGGTVRRRRRAGAWWRGGGRRLSHSELEWALVGQACPWRSPGAVMLLPPPQHRAPPRADAAAV